MIPTSVWPDSVLKSLKKRNFQEVIDWINTENLSNAGFLKACVYDWWNKPLEAADALTGALKKLLPQQRSTYLWYRGLMYIKASMPAWAEQDFDVFIAQSRAHPHLSRLARAYARVLLGDVRGALEDIDGLPWTTTLALDRIVTPAWIHSYTSAVLKRMILKESNDDDAMIE